MTKEQNETIAESRKMIAALWQTVAGCKSCSKKAKIAMEAYGLN